MRGSSEAPGVLLVNIGTPDAPTATAVRRYLAEFLSDPRVVELPRWLWLPILHGFVLRTRPSRSAAMYRRIWTPEGSPMLLYSERLARAVGERLSAKAGRPVPVELGMSYGRPAIPDALGRLLARGARRVVVLPLFPQYAASTTASVFDRVTSTLRGMRRVPGFAFIDGYHDEPGYIAAVAASVREFRSRHGRGEHLLFSFHGLPARMVENGDPYLEQCKRTAALVAGSLQLREEDWQIAFQSRVGAQEWLKPYTDETVEALGRTGMRQVDVVCPGFAVDCLETLEEIRLRYGELFRVSGGGELRYIPALNDRDDHVELLAGLIAGHSAEPMALEAAR